MHEFQGVLTGPRFGFAPEICEEMAVELAGFMEVMPIVAPRERWAGDPGDDPIVEAALQVGAAAVVTGDRLLLETEVPGLEIITVAEMMERLAGR